MTSGRYWEGAGVVLITIKWELKKRQDSTPENGG
jgi:hypothetical protein